MISCHASIGLQQLMVGASFRAPTPTIAAAYGRFDFIGVLIVSERGTWCLLFGAGFLGRIVVPISRFGLGGGLFLGAAKIRQPAGLLDPKLLQESKLKGGFVDAGDGTEIGSVLAWGKGSNAGKENEEGRESTKDHGSGMFTGIWGNE
jgi:hypothetical protein